MRIAYDLLISTILFLGGCSASTSVAPLQPVELTAPDEPVQANTYAVETGRRLLEAGGRRWLEAPVAVVVEQMSYAEAHKWVPMLSEEGDPVWGAQTRVWLVVFKGAWLPTDTTQANPQPVTYPGCLLVLFRAADGALIAAGDSLCPGQQ